MRASGRSTLVTLAAIVLVGATAGTAGADPPAGGAVRVSLGDPYAGCTLGATPTSTVYPGAEVEPDLAVDPRHPQHIVGAWQQDRWNDGGAHGIAGTYSDDGGRTFTEVTLPINACAPGGLSYERASDPWVSIGPDGTVYASALAFDATTARNTVVATVSYDGGRTWKHSMPLINDTTLEFFNDKNSVTADPRRPGTAYTVWDRVDGGPDGTQLLTGPTMMSVTHDGGRTWSTPRVIVPTTQFQQTIGNIIVPDPRTGRLYDFYDSITATDANLTAFSDVSYRMVSSSDGGRTWSAPVVVAEDTSVQDVDPNTGAALRTGSGLPAAAIDPVTGQLYLSYEGTDFTGGAYDQVQLTTSTNGGRTWSAPTRVNGVPSSPAFTPAIAVGPTGDVAITYYDIRTLRPGNTTTLPTSTWETVSPRGGRRFGPERPIAPVFDFLAAPVAGGHFLGDYEGLAAAGTGFRALFVTANSGRPTNSTDAYTAAFGAPYPLSQATSPASLAPLATPSSPPRHPLTRH